MNYPIVLKPYAGCMVLGYQQQRFFACKATVCEFKDLSSNSVAGGPRLVEKPIFIEENSIYVCFDINSSHYSIFNEIGQGYRNSLCTTDYEIISTPENIVSLKDCIPSKVLKINNIISLNDLVETDFCKDTLPFTLALMDEVKELDKANSVMP